MTITFIGHGYVGLVTACVFADLGNTVYVIGRTRAKIEKLKKGDPLIYEPGLKEVLNKNLKAKRLHFTLKYLPAVEKSDIVFISVGTPPKKTGEADLSSVFEVAKKIGKHLKKKYTVVSCKSTVPVGTNHEIYKIIKTVKPKFTEFDVASCPEFLREGSALSDTFYPDRIIIGSDSKKALTLLTKLHKPLNAPVVLTSLESSELIKYASNSVLATKISFANLISHICEKTGADVEEVLEGVGLDKRIGRVFMYPGLGYGGSCFPKDVMALIKSGELLDVDMSLLSAVEHINQISRELFIQKVFNNTEGKTIAIWGLSFKPNTDDIRDAPSIYILSQLLKEGFKIKVYDPAAMDNVKKKFGQKLTFCKDPYHTVDKATTLCICTEWNEFKQIDLERVKKLMRKPVVIDGRNIYNPKSMKKKGFTYISIGR